MAWQIIGFVHPAWSLYGNGSRQLGPLPRKRWIPHPDDPKPRKVKAQQPRCSLSKREYNERKALQYALWLAKRDGIEIPRPVKWNAQVCFAWRHVAIPGKTRKQRYWDGNREVPVDEPRIKAVIWPQLDFGRAVTIEIPHWDHVPTLTVETLGDELQAA